jgi:hypothetical protein
MNKIYVLKRKVIIRGPYTSETLFKRGVKETDMIWYEGLADWTLPKDIDSLKHSIKYISSDAKESTLIEKVFSFLK